MASGAPGAGCCDESSCLACTASMRIFHGGVESFIRLQGGGGGHESGNRADHTSMSYADNIRKKPEAELVHSV